MDPMSRAYAHGISPEWRTARDCLICRLRARLGRSGIEHSGAGPKGCERRVRAEGLEPPSPCGHRDLWRFWGAKWLQSRGRRGCVLVAWTSVRSDPPAEGYVTSPTF